MYKRRAIYIFFILLVLQCVVIVFWGGKKERMHVDEMFTMEGAKQEGTGKCYWDLTEGFYGSEHTSEEFRERLTVNYEDLIIRQGMAKIVDRLLNGNFYYVIVNLVSTIRPGEIPWKLGAGLNLLFFLFSQIILFLTARELFGEICALCATTFYGFSAGAISTVLYVRCYMLLSLYILILIYAYLRLIRATGRFQRGVYVLCTMGIGCLCYLIHQFGTILFVIITVVFVLYMLVQRKKSALAWVLGGYGIAGVLGGRIVFDRLYSFFTSGVSSLFYENVRKCSAIRFGVYAIKLIHIVAEHLFVSLWVFVFFVAGICYYLVRMKIWRNDSVLKEKSMPLVLLAIVVFYYMVLVFGGAIAWRYFCPVYPVIALLVGLCISLVFNTLPNLQWKRDIVIAAGVFMPIISYGLGRISEMYLGKEAARKELEKNYHGVNGIMVHHDYIGIGENWLYEAATLWSQEANVLVIQNKVLREKELSYDRTDDKILLWLTDDYDIEEAMSCFKQCTDYNDIEFVMNIDHLWIYECIKE